MMEEDLDRTTLLRRRRILGTCWVIYGIVRLITAVWLVLFRNTATVMFGALLNRVPDPFTVMSVFHFVYDALIVIAAVCGIVGILAGFALLSGKGSGRTMAIVAAFLSLHSIPVGTTLGIYTLMVLLIWRPQHEFAAGPDAHARQFNRHPVAT